ncbi:hypothetical protein R1flu_014131 [Riccia fluitans]|uniref:Uncharacterized protein n=1 Tax=Riccia fluitans TaxID=41844 RepID=A0ABD1YFK8_9MARC
MCPIGDSAAAQVLPFGSAYWGLIHIPQILEAELIGTAPTLHRYKPCFSCGVPLPPRPSVAFCGSPQQMAEAADEISQGKYACLLGLNSPALYLQPASCNDVFVRAQLLSKDSFWCCARVMIQVEWGRLLRRASCLAADASWSLPACLNYPARSPRWHAATSTFID